MLTVNHFPIRFCFFFFPIHITWNPSKPTFGKWDLTNHLQKCVTFTVWRGQLQLTYVKHLGKPPAADLKLMMQPLSHSTLEFLSYLEHINLVLIWFGLSGNGFKNRLSKAVTERKSNQVPLRGNRTSPLLSFPWGEIRPKYFQLLCTKTEWATWMVSFRKELDMKSTASAYCSSQV